MEVQWENLCGDRRREAKVQYMASRWVLISLSMSFDTDDFTGASSELGRLLAADKEAKELMAKKPKTAAIQPSPSLGANDMIWEAAMGGRPDLKHSRSSDSLPAMGAVEFDGSEVGDGDESVPGAASTGTVTPKPKVAKGASKSKGRKSKLANEILPVFEPTAEPPPIWPTSNIAKNTLWFVYTLTFTMYHYIMRNSRHVRLVIPKMKSQFQLILQITSLRNSRHLPASSPAAWMTKSASDTNERMSDPIKKDSIQAMIKVGRVNIISESLVGSAAGRGAVAILMGIDSDSVVDLSGVDVSFPVSDAACDTVILVTGAIVFDRRNLG
jgi:hypothetical protein